MFLLTRQGSLPKDLGSNPSECHIFNLFRCVLSFFATMAMRWKVQFRLGLAKTLNNIDSNNGIQISQKNNIYIYIVLFFSFFFFFFLHVYIYIYKNCCTIYIYIYIHVHSIKWKHHTRHSTKLNINPVHED